MATYASLRSFLIDRIDETLDDDHVGVEHALRPASAAARTAVGAATSARGTGGGPGVYVQVRKLDGTVLCTSASPQFPRHEAPAPPQLPDDDRRARVAPAERRRPRRATSPCRRRAATSRYRVRASIEPRASDYLLIIATSLSDVDATLTACS